MRFRSILMGFLVVLMGMAAGLLLSLLFWAPAPKPSPTPQGVVNGKVPPEASPSLERAPQTAMKFSDVELTKTEAGPEVSLSPDPLPAQEEKKPETEDLHQRDSAPEFIQEPGAAKQSASQQKRVSSGRAGKDSKPIKSGSEKNSFSFTLHVESFKSAEAAERRVNVLRGQGIDAFSRPVQVPGRGLFHRVFAGKFQGRAEANRFLEKLKAENKIQGGRVISRSEMGG